MELKGCQTADNFDKVSEYFDEEDDDDDFDEDEWRRGWRKC